MSVFKFPGTFGLKTLTIDEEWLTYKDVLGRKNIRVPKSQITGTTVDGGLGYATINVIGGGTTLCMLPKMPRTWAEKLQAMIVAECKL